MRNLLIFGSIIILLVLCALGKFCGFAFFIAAAIFLPIVIIIIYDAFQSKHALLRNFPLLGRSRYMAEWLRPKLYQYFIESDYDGRPFSRLLRNTIYKLIKLNTDNNVFYKAAMEFWTIVWRARKCESENLQCLRWSKRVE